VDDNIYNMQEDTPTVRDTQLFKPKGRERTRIDLYTDSATYLLTMWRKR